MAIVNWQTKSLNYCKKGRIMTRAFRTGLVVILALAFAMPLSACGKKGDLSPPPSHSDPAGD
jgi:predicted small lipoprotein YifL